MQLFEGLRRDAFAHGDGVRATRDIPAGTAIFRLEGRSVPVPHRYSIQKGEEMHAMPDGQLWGYMNHSCEPNCAVDFGTWTMCARRHIRSGEELTFSYLTTEWEMREPFACQCGAEACVGLVRGFAHLPRSARQALLPDCSPYLAGRVHDPQPGARPLHHRATGGGHGAREAGPRAGVVPSPAGTERP